jgi:hypothetical protein
VDRSEGCPNRAVAVKTVCPKRAVAVKDTPEPAEPWMAGAGEV